MSSTELARQLVTQLVAHGVREFVVSPGSRSAPMAYAIADAERAGWLRAHVVVDERSAAFFALGLARASMLRGEPAPVAVVMTSGTAVANAHPAVLEASHSGVPLLIVSTDRPAEWVGTGASQTTVQPGMFGAAVRANVEIPARFVLRAVRGHVARVVAACMGTLTHDPGPAHVNVAFAEPLVPERDWEPGKVPAPMAVSAAPRPQGMMLGAGKRTLVVAGDGAGREAADIAAFAGWPLLAEPSSRARMRGAIVNYLALLEQGLADEAERVVVFGHPTLSRPVSKLLMRTDVELIVVTQTARWTDVGGQANAVVGSVVAESPVDVDWEWLARWREADGAFEAEMTPGRQAALALWNTEEWLLLGSSNTVRYFDAVAPGSERSTRVLANRGLAGIDGLIATARGLNAGLGEPVRVVLGDLSFQHDIGSLVRGAVEAESSVQVIVLNDHGGSIFGTLEHGQADPKVFKRFFATPQQLHVVITGLAVGAAAERVTVADLPEALSRPIVGRSILDVPLA